MGEPLCLFVIFCWFDSSLFLFECLFHFNDFMHGVSHWFILLPNQINTYYILLFMLYFPDLNWTLAIAVIYTDRALSVCTRKL